MMSSGILLSSPQLHKNLVVAPLEEGCMLAMMESFLQPIRSSRSVWKSVK